MTEFLSFWKKKETQKETKKKQKQKWQSYKNQKQQIHHYHQFFKVSFYENLLGVITVNLLPPLSIIIAINAIIIGGARGVMDTATRVQILDEAYCISHSTNTFGKGMNPTILPLAIDE